MTAGQGRPPVLTPEQAARIRELYAAGDVSAATLAGRYQVSTATVWRVLGGRYVAAPGEQVRPRWPGRRRFWGAS